MSHSKSGQHPLPPADVLGHHVLPMYPSSTIQNYYSSPQNVANYVHISTSSQPFQPLFQVMSHFGQMPFPSASQSHRHTPSNNSFDNAHIQHVLTSPFINQPDNISSHSSQHVKSISPIKFINDPKMFILLLLLNLLTYHLILFPIFLHLYIIPIMLLQILIKLIQTLLLIPLL